MRLFLDKKLGARLTKACHILSLEKLSIGGTDRANWHSSWLRFSWCFFDFAEKKPFNSVGTFVVIRIGCIVSAAIGINAGHVGNEELLGAVVAALESFSHRFKIYGRNKIGDTKRHIAFVPLLLIFSFFLSFFIPPTFDLRRLSHVLPH